MTRPKLVPVPVEPAPTSAILNRDLSAAHRARLRQRLKARSVRPQPGATSLLSRPMTCVTIAQGSKDVDCHDLVGLAPFHLKKGE